LEQIREVIPPDKRIGERRLIFSESDVLHWFDSLPDGNLPDEVITEVEAREDVEIAEEVAKKQRR
jgi:hypothetical protein